MVLDPFHPHDRPRHASSHGLLAHPLLARMEATVGVSSLPHHVVMEREKGHAENSIAFVLECVGMGISFDGW